MNIIEETDGTKKTKYFSNIEEAIEDYEQEIKRPKVKSDQLSPLVVDNGQDVADKEREEG